LKNGGNFEVTTQDLANYDPDNLAEPNSTILFVISTYTDGSPPESCAAFYQWLEDFTNDFRVTKTHYQNLRYAVFGIGNSVYGKQFNTVARNLDKMLHSLSANRIVAVGLGDNGAGVEIQEAYNSWLPNLLVNLTTPPVTTITDKTTTSTIKTSEEPDEDEEEEESTGEPLVDMEDLGKMMKKSLLPKKKKKITKVEIEEEIEDEDEEEEEDNGKPKEIREMLTPSLSKALTKQGYKLLGSHSGVKLCRWTKAMLRGRGGCYKHTFYGIQSFQCMEMTPSLACANKVYT
jgi:tRNA wybutosine-synthesizing protein 1